MIKLTYFRPPDQYDEVTVLGTEAGIFDLWWRLTNAPYEHPTHKAGAVRITNLDGDTIDPRKGLQEVILYGTELSRPRS